MQYDITDSRNVILLIQKYLLELAYSYEWGIPVSIDGIYDEKTRSAILALQERYGLPVTGIVDKRTYFLLYDKYLDALSRNGAAVFN